MKKIIYIVLILCNLISFAQENIVKPESDLINFEGKWIGSLTYIDYNSNLPYTMPADVEIIRINDTNYLYKNIYPNEPKANAIDTLTISADGKLFNKKSITSIKRSKNHIEIITEIKGKDGNDNKDATIKNIYFISRNKLNIKKEIKFKDDPKWILRNQYNFFKNN